MKRYAIRDDDCAVEHTHGEWVRYEDAAASVALARRSVPQRAETEAAWNSAAHNARRVEKAEAEIARATGIIRELLSDIRLARRVIGVPYSRSVQRANAWLEDHDAD